MKSLREWSRRYPDKFLDQLPQNWQRRAFLRTTLKTAAVVGLAPMVGALPACSDKIENPALAQEPWPTLHAVHLQLFPQDNFGPGADDIHATTYLFQVLQTTDFDPQEREFILDGVSQLGSVSQELHHSEFLQLTPAQRETTLQALVKYRVGDRWVGSLLTYIMEALLSDPVYGGNPDSVGWRWLDHTPGFPRPPTPYYQRLK